MGKKRTANVQGQGEKKKKEIFRWEEAYNDLPIEVATALREARVKPEQLVKLADGEVLAIEGIRQQNLEDIRAKYPTDLAPITEEKEAKKAQIQEEIKPTSTSSRSRHPRILTGRSKLYKAKKSKTENKVYPISEAVKTLREISYSSHKTIELHLNTKEVGVRGELTLPHSIGKTIRVAIFSPELEAEIKAEKINFDILLAKPSDMAKVAPLARFLGPRGLMPNPKSGTVTDEPQVRAKKLQEGATLSYKTEAKSPLIHLSVGSLTQKDSEIEENLQATLNGIGLNKLKSAYLKTTMSPSVRLDLNL